MWGLKKKSIDHSLPQTSSPTPFFPDVSAKVSYHSSASVAKTGKHGMAQGHRAVEQQLAPLLQDSFGKAREEWKDNNSPSSNNIKTRYGDSTTPTANPTNLYPRSSPSSSTLSSSSSAASLPSKKSLSTSQSSADLPMRNLTKHMGHSLSMSQLADRHDVVPGAFHYSGPASLSSNLIAPSNASAKLATRVDRWQSVEELLDHSQAVIAAGSRGLTTGAAAAASHAASLGYDPASFATFSAGDPTPLREKDQPASPKKLKPAQKAGAAAASAKSPFSTTAPPPAPTGVQATWGGLNPHHRSASEHSLLANQQAMEFLHDVKRKLAALENDETTLTVKPSVLFSAGLTLSNNAPVVAASKRAGSPDRYVSATDVGLSSKTATEKLWQQHQAMMREARSQLPSRLQTDTQSKLVDSLQNLQPRVLLDLISPQFQILKVSLAEFIALLSKEDKEQSVFLKHLQAHQTLLVELLMHFAQMATPSLEGHDVISDSLDSRAGGRRAAGQHHPGGAAAADGSESMRKVRALMQNAPELESMSLAALLSPPKSLIQASTKAHLQPRPSSQQQQQHLLSSVNESSSQLSDDFDQQQLTHLHESLPRSTNSSDSYNPEHGTLGHLHDLHEESSGRYEREEELEDSETGLSRSVSRGNSAMIVHPSSAGALSKRTAASSLSQSQQLDPYVLASLNEQDKLDAMHISFGNTHAWEIERWRQHTLTLRKQELQHEHAFLQALQYIKELAEIRQMELDEIDSIHYGNANRRSSMKTGSAKTVQEERELYKKVHGSFESRRLRLQQSLDEIKLSLDPTYASKYFRFHQQILNLDHVTARINRALARGGAFESESDRLLAIHLDMLKQGEANHSTNQSAFVSSTPGGKPHRLPHTTWLTTSTPSSRILGLDESGGANQNGSSATLSGIPSPTTGEPASLRDSRIEALVSLENMLSAAADHEAQMQEQYRSVSKQLEVLTHWKEIQLKQTSENSLMHRESVARAEKSASAAIDRANKLDDQLRQAKADLLAKDVKIQQLYTEIQNLSYTTKQLQVTYTQHALFKKPVMDSGVGQTEESHTGERHVGWDENFNYRPIVVSPEAGAIPGAHPNMTEEELAALTAAGLSVAPKEASSLAFTTSPARGGKKRQLQKKAAALSTIVNAASAAAHSSPLSGPASPETMDQSRRNSADATSKSSSNRRSSSLGVFSAVTEAAMVDNRNRKTDALHVLNESEHRQ